MHVLEAARQLLVADYETISQRSVLQEEEICSLTTESMYALILFMY
jgi:hypothetical protein